MEGTKLSNTRMIFRIINDELEHFSTCRPMDVMPLVHKLKTINEELCDLVVDMMKENQRLKKLTHD